MFEWLIALIGYVLLRRERARRLSFDASTRLPTRSALVVELEHAIKQNRPRRPTGVIMFDFSDHEPDFDTAMKAAERELLLDLGRLLRSWVPAQHFVAHLRYREFAVLVADSNSLGEVEHLADTVVERLRSAKRLGGRPRSIVTFYGLAFSDNSKDKAKELMSNADIALSRARSTGRARYVVVGKLPTRDLNAAA